MDWGSVIAGAIGGAGHGAAQYAQGEIEQDHRMELMREQQRLEQARDEAAVRFRMQAQADFANQERTAMADRIGKAQDGIIAERMGDKYRESDAAVADADAGKTDMPLSDEQRTVIQQSKDADRAAERDNPDTYIRAAMKTGDLDPKTVATLNNKSDMAERRAQALLDRANSVAESSRYRSDIMERIAQIRADAARDRAAGKGRSGGSGGGDANDRLYMREIKNDIRTNTSRIRDLQKQHAAALDEKDKADLQQQINDLTAENASLQADYQEFAKGLGLNVPERGATRPGGEGGGTVRQPAIGAVVNGYRFLGGDPKQQSSWEKAGK